MLSRQDREPTSRTYGNFDRTWWGWKFVDFAGARFQEGVYALAHAWRWPLPGFESAVGSPRLRQWAEAGLSAWCRLQYRDGSFDEAYPFEHSLAATAFTLFYLGEACRVLQEDEFELPPAVEALPHTLERAACWLCDNDEHHGVLSNHLAAAAAALDVAGRLCGEGDFLRRRDHFVDRILERQHAEGWYEEYGGADPGYQTHATFYLARIWQQTGDSTLLDSLRRSMAFLEHCVHPDGTLGGEYGSRNTELYYPAGFEMLAPVSPEAARIAAFLRPTVAARRNAGPSTVDAYNLCPQLNNYLFAHRFRVEARYLQDLDPLPCQRSTLDRRFPAAGLRVVARRKYFAIVGYGKGGVVRAWQRRGDGERPTDYAGRQFSDAGWWAETSAGRISSQARVEGLSAGPKAQLPSEGTEDAMLEETVQARFTKINQTVFSPWLFGAFRLFNLTLGRWPAAARWVKDILVRVLVRRQRPVPVVLERRITLAEASIDIEDRVALEGSELKVRTLGRLDKFSAIHMGSARYFQLAELELPPQYFDSKRRRRELAERLEKHGEWVEQHGWSATIDTSAANPPATSSSAASPSAASTSTGAKI